MARWQVMNGTELVLMVKSTDHGLLSAWTPDHVQWVTPDVAEEMGQALIDAAKATREQR
jgi:hypothetical protein